MVSLITGEKLKTLKRHLRAQGLTKAEYRERYNLPEDYPHLASCYSHVRQNVAKMGFGKRNEA
jgi:predicted transcriptional regulator